MIGEAIISTLGHMYFTAASAISRDHARVFSDFSVVSQVPKNLWDKNCLLEHDKVQRWIGSLWVWCVFDVCVTSVWNGKLYKLLLLGTCCLQSNLRGMEIIYRSLLSCLILFPFNCILPELKFDIFAYSNIFLALCLSLFIPQNVPKKSF